jgi:hypothetical protein
VWSRGTIATELDFDHDDLPMYLVDSRTREGQSGAPVIWYSSRGQIPAQGGLMLSDGKSKLEPEAFKPEHTAASMKKDRDMIRRNIHESHDH